MTMNGTTCKFITTKHGLQYSLRGFMHTDLHLLWYNKFNDCKCIYNISTLLPYYNAPSRPSQFQTLPSFHTPTPTVSWSAPSFLVIKGDRILSLIWYLGLSICECGRECQTRQRVCGWQKLSPWQSAKSTYIYMYISDMKLIP